jgi:phosphoglycerol transferase MdoB-like AlkP superfamily enzyme
MYLKILTNCGMNERLHTLKGNAYGRIAILFFVCLIPFTIARALIYTTNHADFTALSVGQVISAFVVGLRFDASIVATAMGLPLLLMLLPFDFCHRRLWQGICGWASYILLVVLVFLMIADMFYFSLVHRHAGPEVSTLGEDMSTMIYMAVQDFPLALTVFVMAAVAAVQLWRSLLSPIAIAPKKSWLRLINIFVLLLVLVLIGRGGLQYKPVSVSDAFFIDSAAAGYLALNGPFSILHAVAAEKPVVKDFMPEAEAARITQDWLRSSGDQFSDPAFPLLRVNASDSSEARPNIVVLLLESWDATNVDAMRAAAGKPTLGATPSFDALARTGRLYTNFHAVGQRSIDGIAGVLSGIPTTPGMPSMGSGLEQNRLSFLGEQAKAQGYSTIFLQSSKRGSFYVDAIAARAGFETYLGAEDIPELHTDKLGDSGWGAWDHSTLQAAHQLFSQARKPFLGFIFTSSTHTPYVIPTERWRKFPGKQGLDMFLNTLFYADWALGKFIAAAKQAGYYDNTIFVLTGDHVSHFVDESEQLPNLYRVPLLLVGPGISPGIDNRVGGHLDIIPTLIDAADWNTKYAALGRSLLDDERPQARAAFSVRASVVDWIADDGWLSHNIQHRLGASPGLAPARADDMERQLTAVFQIISRALVENRIAN